MMRSARRTRPSWHLADSFIPRPELWVFAGLVLGMLLIEVWQSSRMAVLGIELDRAAVASRQAVARVENLRANAERRITRAELAPVASRMGLVPADAQQVVMLPAEYLADEPPAGRDAAPATLFAWAERVWGALVPEATARVRTRR
jgi:hypothetical protein